MKIFGSNLFFRGKDFATIKHFRPKNFSQFFFFLQTCFRGNDSATIKNFRPKHFFMKIFSSNLFSRKWFCNYKKFYQNIFMKIFGSNLFSRKWLCNHKKLSTKNFLKMFLLKFLVQLGFLGNDFATIKNFRSKNLYDNLWFKPVFEKLNLQP